MRYAIMILALVGVLASPRPAAATAMSGNQLLKICDLKGADGLACKSYFIGFYGGFMWTTAMVGQRVKQKIWPQGHNPLLNICLPKGATVSQITRVGLKYLRENPEKLHQPAGAHVLASFITGFPCPKN